jgi:putative lipoprotein
MKEAWFRRVLETALLSGLACSFFGQAASPNAGGELAGTSWELVKFQGGDEKILTPEDKSKYTVAFAKDSVSVRIDCNRGHGTWKSSGPNQLEFGPMALTRAMCPAAELNDRLPKDWENVRSYVLRDGHLFLSLMADGGIYEFAPMNAGESAQIKGTAIYRELMVLPGDAVFEATLEDVSRAGARAEVVGQTRVEHPGNPPIAFTIPYDPAKIQAGHRYAVPGRILVEGNPFFTTDKHYPVLGAGQKNDVALLLRRASAAGNAKGAMAVRPASLENTAWKLIELGGTEVAPANHENEAHLVLNSKTHRVSGSGGCNRLTGNYEVKGDQLTFSQMASTMMACPEGMDTEKAFLDALNKVKAWKIEGKDLELLDGDARVVARFVSLPAEAGEGKPQALKRLFLLPAVARVNSCPSLFFVLRMAGFVRTHD